MLALIMVLAMVPALAETEPTETINIPVTKKWDDKDNEDKRPDSITVKLMNGNDVIQAITINKPVDDTDTWQGNFTITPEKDGIYTVQEEGVPAGYKVTYEQPTISDYMVTFGGIIEANDNQIVDLSKNLIIFKNPAYIWTKEEIPEADKADVIAKVKASADKQLTASWKEGEVSFIHGFGKGIDGKFNITADDTTKKIKVEWVKQSDKSLIGYGTLSLPTATAAVITNTYEFTPESDFDAGTIIIKKTVEGLPKDRLPTSFTFEIKQGENTQTVIANREGNDNTYKSETVQLSPGEYTVEEIINSEVQVDGYILTTPDAQSFTIEVGKITEVTFTNKYVEETFPGVIIVKKTVESNNPTDKDKEFNFKVTVITAPNPDPSGPLIAKSANAVKAPAVRAVDNTATKDKDDFVNENGIPTLYFNLKDGDMMTISNLPVEKCTYHVEELDAAGYTVTVNNEPTSSKDVGLTKEKPEMTLEFKNTKGSTPTPTPTPYNGGGGYYYPTTTPVPVIVIPPKTGDMTIWQSILHFLGIR